MRGPARLVELPKLDESLIVEADLQTSLTSSGYPPDRTRTLFQGSAAFDCLRTDDAVKLWDRGHPFAAVRKKLKTGSCAFAVHRISAEKQEQKCCFWEVIKKGEDIFCFRSPKAGGRFLTSRWSKGKKCFYLAAVELNETLQDFWRLKQIARTGYVRMDFLFQNVHWKEHEMMIEIERYGMFGPFRNLEPVHGSEDARSQGSSMYSGGPPGDSSWNKNRISELETENYALESENERLNYELKLLKQQQCTDSEVSGKRVSPLREVQHQEKVFPDDCGNSIQSSPNKRVENEDTEGAESKIKHRSLQLDEKEEKLNASQEDLNQRLATFSSRIRNAENFEIELHKRECRVAAKEAMINKWQGSINGEVSALKSKLNEAAHQFDARFHAERHAFKQIVLDAYRDDQQKRMEQSSKAFQQSCGERIMNEMSSLRHAFKEVRLEVETSMQANQSTFAETKASLLHVAENADAKSAKVTQLAGELNKVQDKFKECHEELAEEFEARYEHCVKPLCEMKLKLEQSVLVQASKDKETREKCAQAADSLKEVREDIKSVRQEMVSEIDNIRGFLKGIAQALGEKAFNLELERQKFAEECKNSQKAFQLKVEAIAAEVGNMKAANARLREDLIVESKSCKQRAQEFIREAVEQTVIEQKKHMKAELPEYRCEVEKLREDMQHLKNNVLKERDSLRVDLDFVSQQQKTISIDVATQDASNEQEERLGLAFGKWKDMLKIEAREQESAVEEDADLADCEEVLNC